MYTFNLTKEAAMVAVAALSVDGKLDLVVTMPKKNTLQFALCKDGVEITKMDPLPLSQGDSITLQGMKFIFDIDGGQ